MVSIYFNEAKGWFGLRKRFLMNLLNTAGRIIKTEIIQTIVARKFEDAILRY